MARISTFLIDANITDGDKILGTDAADNSTKNFTIGGLQDYILDGNLFASTVPTGGLAVSGIGGSIRQSVIQETTVATPNVAIPANFVFFLGSNTEGFFIEIRNYGSPVTEFPYDASSFIGKTWVADGYTIASGQVLTEALDPAFTGPSNNQILRFRTIISTPLAQDQDPTSLGRALTNVVISSLDQVTVAIGAGINFPTTTPAGANVLYTQTGTQLGFSGAQALLKFVLQT